MNTLSWLFLLADWSENLGGIAGMSAFLLSIFVGVLFATYFFARLDKAPIAKDLRSVGVILSWPLVISIFLMVITPEKETIMFIAASEMGEEVLTSGEVNETFNLLKENVDQYLRDNLRGSTDE